MSMHKITPFLALPILPVVERQAALQKKGRNRQIKVKLQKLDLQPSHLVWSVLVALSSLAAHAVCPDSVLQHKMLAEERAFLAAMKPGLQHTQMLAVRRAVQGDDTQLRQIRQSRNQAPVLPQGVSTSYPAPDICLFSPREAAQRKRPVLLYLHGGGWCFGSINSCARFCAAVALEADCIVAALNYRLAPEHPFPMPLEDCQRAVAFLRSHAVEWGGDSTQIAVGGDSAGGNLALATALSVGGISKVIPIYPVTRLFTEHTPSWHRYAVGYGNDAELLEAFNEAYARQQVRHPLVSVGLCSDDVLKALPPALFISAGHDILLDQTAELVARLQQLGCPVQHDVYPTATHLFITVPGQPTAFGEAVRAVGRFLNGVR